MNYTYTGKQATSFSYGDRDIHLEPGDTLTLEKEVKGVDGPDHIASMVARNLLVKEDDKSKSAK